MDRTSKELEGQRTPAPGATRRAYLTLAGSPSRGRSVLAPTAGATRRAYLALAGSSLAGLAAVACGGEATPTAKPASGPVTIDVLTYAGITSPTGRGQWYAKITPQTFTPQ